MEPINSLRISAQSDMIEYQKHSDEWTFKTNVDCPWNVMLIPENFNREPYFSSSIIYFNKGHINSEITIIPTPVSSYQEFEPYRDYCFIVEEHLIPLLREFDIRKNWKQLSEEEQEIIMKTINEWLLEQLQNVEKKYPDNKVILFFYGIIEKRAELNGFVKNSIDYISRHVIKIF